MTTNKKVLLSLEELRNLKGYELAGKVGLSKEELIEKLKSL